MKHPKQGIARCDFLERNARVNVIPCLVGTKRFEPCLDFDEPQD